MVGPFDGVLERPHAVTPTTSVAAVTTVVRRIGPLLIQLNPSCSGASRPRESEVTHVTLSAPLRLSHVTCRQAPGPDPTRQRFAAARAAVTCWPAIAARITLATTAAVDKAPVACAEREPGKALHACDDDAGSETGWE